MNWMIRYYFGRSINLSLFCYIQDPTHLLRAYWEFFSNGRSDCWMNRANNRKSLELRQHGITWLQNWYSKFILIYISLNCLPETWLLAAETCSRNRGNSQMCSCTDCTCVCILHNNFVDEHYTSFSVVHCWNLIYKNSIVLLRLMCCSAFSV